MLGYSERQIRRLCIKGYVPEAIKRGGFWRIPSTTIEKLQAEQKKLIARETRILQLLKPYVLLYLSTVGQKEQEVGQEILALYSQPILDDMTKSHIKELQEKLEGFSRYSEQILRDLEAAEKLISQ